MSEAQTNTELRERVAELETRVQELEQLVEPQTQESTTSDTIADVEIMDSSVFESDDVVAKTAERNTIIKETLALVREFEAAYGEPVPIDHLIEELNNEGYETSDVLDVIDRLRRQGDIYEPVSDCVKVV